MPTKPFPTGREERRVRIDDMKRGQLEVLAGKLKIDNPQHYNLPELRETVKLKYRQKKEREQ